MNLGSLLQRALVIGLALLALLSVSRAGWNAMIGDAATPYSASIDFLWHEARTLLQGNNPYDVAPQQLATRPASPAWGRWLTPAVPSSLVFLWPYALFSYQTAVVLWFISNLLATLLILSLSFRLFLPNASRNLFVFLGIILLIGAPWRFSVGLGQHGLVCLAAFLLSFYLMRQNRTFLASIFLAFSFLKYTLIFPFLPLLLKHRYYAVIVLACSLHFGLLVFVAGWLGELPHLLIIQHLEVAMSMQSDGLVDVGSLDQALGAPLGQAGALLLGLALLTGVGWLCVVSDADDLLVLSVLSILSMVLVYHRIQDFIVLLFPLLLLVRETTAGPASAGGARLAREWPGWIFLASVPVCLVMFWVVMGVAISLEHRLNVVEIGGLRFDAGRVLENVGLLSSLPWYAALFAGVAVLAARR